MVLRRSLLLIASTALAALLIAVLVEFSKVDIQAILRQLRHVSLIAFAKIALLNVLLVYLSTEKWRSIDSAWRRPSDSVPSRTTSFALTSVGLAMGILLPVQFAMATARTLGTYVHGRALRRGTAGTLLEQGFDILTVGFLALASAITWLSHGGAMTWTFTAAVAMTLALLAVGLSIRVIRWLSVSYNATVPRNRILRSIRELEHSGLLNAGLARRLVVLSTLRYGAVVWMSTQTADAVGLHIPIWQMAAAIPFVIVATVIAVTPGGIGVNELACATSLKIFGTPLAVGAQWALANRVLMSVSYLLVALLATGVMLTAKGTVPRTRGTVQGCMSDLTETHGSSNHSGD